MAVEPGDQGAPFTIGSPGVPASGADPGGPNWIGVRGPLNPTPVLTVGGITPGESILAIVSPPSPLAPTAGAGQAPHANSSARLSQGGGTYPS
jgi:hypothetical protein